MKTKSPIIYYDRNRGQLATERVYAGAFLYWSYNTWLGAFAAAVIYRTKFFSQLYGWFGKCSYSRRHINNFVQKLDIDTDELTRPLSDFTSLNDFFIRDIDLSRRPLAADPAICTSPVDGKVLAYRAVDSATTLRVKCSVFNLCTLLRDNRLAEYFAGGTVVICRLSLRDYHHFHFPDSGTSFPVKAIPGTYHPGGPYSLRSLIPFYADNHRMITIFDSDHFGRMALIEIGAFTVGSICQRFRTHVRVVRGGHKGYFELGGSTVVLLFRQGVIRLDDDLVSNTKREIETYVRFGDSLGRATGSGEVTQ
jgi:phosphatidylserine decarboxylase